MERGRGADERSVCVCVRLLVYVPGSLSNSVADQLSS
jgi:hypothetical protein